MCCHRRVCVIHLAWEKDRKCVNSRVTPPLSGISPPRLALQYIFILTIRWDPISVEEILTRAHMIIYTDKHTHTGHMCVPAVRSVVCHHVQDVGRAAGFDGLIVISETGSPETAVVSWSPMMSHSLSPFRPTTMNDYHMNIQWGGKGHKHGSHDQAWQVERMVNKNLN